MSQYEPRYVVVGHRFYARWIVKDTRTGRLEGEWLAKRRWAQDLADAANANAAQGAK